MKAGETLFRLFERKKRHSWAIERSAFRRRFLRMQWLYERRVLEAPNFPTSLLLLLWGAVLSVLGMASNASAQGVPTMPSIVTVKANDRRIWVQDRLSDNSLGAQYPLVIKGINWEPTSPGTDPVSNPGAFQAEYAKWAATDIPLMAQMGVNVIRVYHDFGTIQQAQPILDLCYQNGIKVIMTVDSPTHGSVNNTANIPNVVQGYKNHPAILMWAVGQCHQGKGIFVTV
jgi:hypothetical protein